MTNLFDGEKSLPMSLEQVTLEAKFYYSQTQQNIIEFGKRLSQAKSMLSHGKWLTWLEKHFNLKTRMAQNYMSIAERFGNTQTSAYLNQSQMIEMLALPPEETEKFIEEKIAEGKRISEMTIKNLRAEIKNYQSQLEESETAHKARIAEIEQERQQCLFDYDQKIQSLEKRLDEKPEKIVAEMKKLQEECAETREELADKKSELTEALSKVNDLQLQLNTAMKNVEKLINTNERFERKHYTLQKELPSDACQFLARWNQKSDSIAIE